LVDAGWAGRPARPTGEQKTRVEAELRAHAGMPPRGWPRWSRRSPGACYHPGHARRLLREPGRSPQRPARCARRTRRAGHRWIKHDGPG